MPQPQFIESREEMERFLGEEILGYLGIMDGEQPYVVPLNYAYADGKILFHCALEGAKLDAIRRNPLVCFSVARQTGTINDHYNAPCHLDSDSVICYGRARLIEDLKERELVLNAFNHHHRPTEPDLAPARIAKCMAVEIAISEMTGRRERDERPHVLALRVLNMDDRRLEAPRPVRSLLGCPERLRQRVFAWMDARSGRVYDHLTEARKRALLGDLHGDLLEIGPGAGPNLRYYPQDVRWLGVEPNPYMRVRLSRAISALGRPQGFFRVVCGDRSEDRLPAEDEAFDAVVSTLVLCSVPDPEGTLREIVRVLKPGGRFVFMEHVAASRGSSLRAWQDLLQPVWTWLAAGCHPNRETWETIAQAGFAEAKIEHFWLPNAGLEAPQIAGVASKSPGWLVRRHPSPVLP